MPVTSRPVQIKLPPKTFLRLIQFGKDHNILSEEGPSFGGRVVRHIVEVILKIDADPAIEKIKTTGGRNTLDIIQEAVSEKTSEE